MVNAEILDTIDTDAVTLAAADHVRTLQWEPNCPQPRLGGIQVHHDLERTYRQYNNKNDGWRAALTKNHKKTLLCLVPWAISRRKIEARHPGSLPVEC